jgi:S1-C subfamily serine protease
MRGLCAFCVWLSRGRTIRLKVVATSGGRLPPQCMRVQDGALAHGGEEAMKKLILPIVSAVLVAFPVLPKAQETLVSVADATGFYITPTGDLLTAAHAVDGCTSVYLLEGTYQKPAKLVSIDRELDLAIVRTVEKPAAVASFRDGAVLLGEPVVVVGFPLTDLLSPQHTVTTGSISALAGAFNDSTMFQLTAPIQPGSSGGPVLDMSGNIVGVIRSKLSAAFTLSNTGTLPENVNFAIKLVYIDDFLRRSAVVPNRRSTDQLLSVPAVAGLASKYTVLVRCIDVQPTDVPTAYQPQPDASPQATEMAPEAPVSNSCAWNPTKYRFECW